MGVQQKAPCNGIWRVLWHGVESERLYYIFILVSSAFRSYEAGIISATIPTIKADLALTYTRQGVVSASSDYGLLPSGLIAMVVLTRFSAYHVLMAVYFLIALASLLCFMSLHLSSLIAMRVVTSLLWGMAAVHYPAWVNGHGDRDGKTMRLAVLNAMMLVGILGGYLVGGVARSLGYHHWVTLYAIEAILMLVCVIGSGIFAPKLVCVEGEHRPEHWTAAMEDGPASERDPLVETASATQPGFGWRQLREFGALMTCPLYLCAVGVSSAISGVVGFILYFVTQVAEQAIGFDRRAINAMVGVVFVLGPVGGNIGGGWWLSMRGGYQNCEGAFKLVAQWCFCAWVCSGFLPIAASLRSQSLFTASIFGLLFFGAMPIAAINGITVSAVPGRAAATYGSGFQFFCQHLVKMVAPMIGGCIIDGMGLGPGFSVTVIAFGGLLNILACLGYVASWRHQAEKKELGVDH